MTEETAVCQAELLVLDTVEAAVFESAQMLYELPVESGIGEEQNAVPTSETH